MFKIKFLCLYTSTFYYSTNKSVLSKLRKTTGFSFLNCKEALDKFDYDFKKAEKYLKEQAQLEGWTKSTKLQGRPMSQGLIGIILKNNSASMVEVNCESDFVSRNIRFKNFTSLVCSALHFHGLELSQNKIHYEFNKMATLEMNSKTISDLTALEIGSLGENIHVRRGIFIRALPNHYISYYIHETGPKIDSSVGLCNFGKYGAIVVFSKDETLNSTDENVLYTIDQIGRELCQHIVGMKPLCINREDSQLDIKQMNVSNVIGNHQEKEMYFERNETEIECKGTQDFNNLTESNQSVRGRLIEEDRLLKQEFILNTDITVQQYLKQQGVHVLDFTRFECGEDLTEETQII